MKLGLLVESDGDLTPESAKYLTAEALLRLVSERHPSKNLVAYAASNLPILPSYYVEGIRQGGAPPVYMQVAAPRKTFLPSIQSQGPATVAATPLPVSECFFLIHAREIARLSCTHLCYLYR